MFVIALYCLRNIQSIDEACYVLFCTKNHLSQQLPPTQDALRNHVKRANFQAAIWKRALEAKTTNPPFKWPWLDCARKLSSHPLDGCRISHKSFHAACKVWVQNGLCHKMLFKQSSQNWLNLCLQVSWELQKLMNFPSRKKKEYEENESI